MGVLKEKILKWINDLNPITERGIDNPYEYYPNSVMQDRNKSIIDHNGSYDMLEFSSHEDKVIFSVINSANLNYPSKYRAIGLANESYPIMYKPRHVLFELVVIAFKDSEAPFDQIAVSFAYIQKGAHFRQEAIKYFESAIDRIKLNELNKFSSLSVLNMISSMAKVYEQEHEYKKAIKWLDFLIQKGIGGTGYFIDKKAELKVKDENWKPLRRRAISEDQIRFEERTHDAAIKYIHLLVK